MNSELRIMLIATNVCHVSHAVNHDYNRPTRFNIFTLLLYAEMNIH